MEQEELVFVITNSGNNNIALTDTDSQQITVLPVGCCFGWVLTESDPVLLTAVNDTELFFVNNGLPGDASIKVEDDLNNEVTILQPGSRYPTSSSHTLKSQTSLLLSFVPVDTTGDLN